MKKFVNPSIFRAYDIRGIVDKDFNKQDAETIGKAFGTYIQEIAGPRIVVGHDNRFTSDELNAYFVRGLLSTGCKITDVGLSLTPIINFATIFYGFDGGVMITGSHNPKDFNGLRFVKKQALPIYNSEIQKIREILESSKFKIGKGDVEYREVFGDYAAAIYSRIELARPLKVILDCANGTPSEFAPILFENLGCQLSKIHCLSFGDYPYHTPDPEEKITLLDAQKLVVEKKADLGIGFDTDGDRFGIIDEAGQIYENDKIMIILAREVLKHHPGSKVLFDIKSSYVLENEIKKSGGIPEMVKTGHPYFRMAMVEDPNIFLAGEVSSHTFIKDGYYGFDDGLFAAAKVLEILSKTKHLFSEFFAEVEKTAHTEELKAPCPDEKKFEIEKALSKEFSKNYKTITIDGVRIVFSKTAWALVRASNTGPYLSLRFEAKDKKKLKEIVEIVKSRLQKYPVVDYSCLENLDL